MSSAGRLMKTFCLTFIVITRIPNSSHIKGQLKLATACNGFLQSLLKGVCKGWGRFRPQTNKRAGNTNFSHMHRRHTCNMSARDHPQHPLEKVSASRCLQSLFQRVPSEEKTFFLLQQSPYSPMCVEAVQNAGKYIGHIFG